MDTYKLKWTRLQEEIFRFLCIKASQTFNLRGLARPLKVSPTAISSALVELEKNNLIKVKKSKTMNLLSIELNRDNKRTIELKRVKNLRAIYESGLSDFLFNGFPGATIILFGSFSRGDDYENSDIDIAIIGRKEKEINLKSYEEKLEKEIILNFYKSFKDIHKNLKENICNGIVLVGGIEL